MGHFAIYLKNKEYMLTLANLLLIVVFFLLYRSLHLTINKATIKLGKKGEGRLHEAFQRYVCYGVGPLEIMSHSCFLDCCIRIAVDNGSSSENETEVI